MKHLFIRLLLTVLAVLSPISPHLVLANTITPENAGQVSELERYGDQIVNDIVLSPDGRLVVVVTRSAIEVRNADKLSVIIRTIQTDASIQDVIFDPSGQILAGIDRNKTIYLWRMPDGQLVRKIKIFDEGRISHLTFSASGEFLMFLVGNTIKTLKIFDGEIATTFETKISGFDELVISPDAQTLAVARGNLVMLLRSSGEVFRILKGHTSEISELAISSDGQRLASKSRNGAIVVWSMDQGKPLIGLESPSPDLSRLSFSLDGRFLVVATQKVGASIWDLETGEQISSVQEPNIQIRELSVSRDGKLLLTDSTSELLTWQILGARQLDRLSLPKIDPPQRIAFSNDGEIVASSFIPGRAQVRQVSDGRRTADLSSDACCWVLSLIEDVFPLSYTPVAISPRKRMIALSVSNRRNLRSNADESLVLMQNLKQEARSEFPISDKILSLAFSPDEQLLACGGDRVHLVNTRNRRVIRTLEHAKQSVTGLAFSSNGRLLAAASLDGVIRLWQVANGRLVRELPKQEKAILAIAFSPDNALLATAGADQTVRLWRVADGKLTQTLKGHESIVGALTFSADGALLASGALDGAINLWQVSDGKLLKTLKGHTDNVLGVAFMKDGRLASTSSDGTTRLWGVK